MAASFFCVSSSYAIFNRNEILMDNTVTIWTKPVLVRLGVLRMTAKVIKPS